MKVLSVIELCRIYLRVSGQGFFVPLPSPPSNEMEVVCFFFPPLPSLANSPSSRVSRKASQRADDAEMHHDKEGKHCNKESRQTWAFSTKPTAQPLPHLPQGAVKCQACWPGYERPWHPTTRQSVVKTAVWHPDRGLPPQPSRTGGTKGTEPLPGSRSCQLLHWATLCMPEVVLVRFHINVHVSGED